jgi:thiamine-phosphate pyrophosphorylase
MVAAPPRGPSRVIVDRRGYALDVDARERSERLAAARLYFVCDAGRAPEQLQVLLEAAVDGGADVVQLRDKDAPERSLLAAASLFRDAADAAGALFILNDRPDLVPACSADGVHVGQEDLGVAEARARAGAGALVGLSTHRPAQLEAAEHAEGPDRPDYLSVGPVWETPTKEGRPAAGLDYVRHAAANATLPWFAIGSIDPDNVGEVIAAGARRVVVVRAIRDAGDPRAAAATLRGALDRVADPIAG